VIGSFASLPQSPSGRAIASALFGLAALTFVLPFLSVEADRRRAEATGIELVTSSVRFSGTYVQQAFRGEAERWAHAGERPALIAFCLLLSGLVLVWLPWRIGPTAATLCGALALVAFYALYQRVGSRYALAITHHRAGMVLAIVLASLAFAWSILLFLNEPYWWRARPGGGRDYFPPPDPGRG
jgi:hypothetical protein